MKKNQIPFETAGVRYKTMKDTVKQTLYLSVLQVASSSQM